MPKRPSNPRNQDRHKQPRLAFHLPQDLFDAFNEFVDSLEPRPNESEVLRLALREFLVKRAFWPPPEKGGKP